MLFSDKVETKRFTLLLSIVVTCLFGLPTYAQYSGGTGDPNDPYQIATADELMLLGETPEDYDKHFILCANIDLDPNLPGRRVFDRAVIAPDTVNNINAIQGIPFTGVFDGGGHTVSHLTISGHDDYLGLFGQTGPGAKISSLGLEAVGVNGTGGLVGSLVGINCGTITSSYYGTGTVTGEGWPVGGLVGENRGSITRSNSTGTVTGRLDVGGLAGENYGSISDSYSIGMVTGGGGLVGRNTCVIPDWRRGSISLSFWDVQASGQTNMCDIQDEGAIGCDGSFGLTTAEMQTASTFLEAGWDFIDEATNGTEDIWWIDEGQDYPRLWWEEK